IAGPGSAGLVGDISKCTVAVVVIERVANRDPAVVEIASVHKVDVLPSVSIKVGNADARAEFFPVDGDAFVSLEVNELDSPLRRYTRKLDRFPGRGGEGGEKSGKTEKTKKKTTIWPEAGPPPHPTAANPRAQQINKAAPTKKIPRRPRREN